MGKGKWLVTGFIGSLLILIGFLALPSYAEDASVSIGVGDTTFTVQGYASPLALVTIMDGASVIGTTTADSAGIYSQHFTNQSAGLHALQVYAKDSAGRTTTPVVIEVNVTEHAETTVDLFLPPTIQLSTTSVSRGGTIVLEGEGTPGTTVIIYIDDGHVTTTVDSAGKWRFDLTTDTLTGGSHQLFVIAQQSGGGQSYPSSRQSFVVLVQDAPNLPGAPSPAPSSQQIPTVPTILQPKPGTIINDTSILVSGAADPGARVEVWNNDRLVGAVIADSNGRWQLFIPLVDGANNVKARACVGDMCSGFSSIVTVQSQSRFGEGLQFSLKEYVYHTQIGGTTTLHALLAYGRPPYEFVIKWGDGNQDAVTSWLTDPKFSHRFTKVGNFNGVITVRDADGESAQRSFVTHVTPRPFSLWWLLFFLLLILIVWLVWRHRKSWREESRQNIDNSDQK